MELTGEYKIPAPRQTVWEGLNDPETLKACIPGCEELEKSGDDSFAAKVKSKIGPVSAKFSGEVTLSDLNPPESYTISGEGKGGAAGFAKGSARVNLAVRTPRSSPTPPMPRSGASWRRSDPDWSRVPRRKPPISSSLSSPRLSGAVLRVPMLRKQAANPRPARRPRCKPRLCPALLWATRRPKARP